MKRKRKNKLIALVLAVSVFVCGLIMPGSAADISTEPMLPVDLPDQRAALAANELLWQTFTLGENGMPIAYPEEYGGAFIDGELLYIYIVGLNDELEAKYMEICKGSPVVRFLEADYSANYLMTLYDVVAEYENEYSITSYGIDFKNNRFRIELNGIPAAESANVDGIGEANKVVRTYDTQRNELMSKLGAPAVAIEAGAYAETTSTNIYGGQKILFADYDGEILENDWGSIAIAGTFSTGQPAILTAGHCFLNSDGESGIHARTAIHQPSNTTIGNYAVAQYYKDETGDYAIVPISSSSLIGTNDIYYDFSLSTPILSNVTGMATSFAAGQLVFFSGSTTDYTTFGYLKSYTERVNYGTEAIPLYIYGLCTVDSGSSAMLVKDGDSGGPAFISAGNTSNYFIAGNISGRKHMDADFSHNQVEINESYFSPISLAHAAGFTPLMS